MVRHACRVVVGVLSVLVVFGCTRVVWVKPGVSEQEFRVDSYVCEKDMRQSGYFGTGISGAMNASGFYERCMESKGYQKIREVPTSGVDHIPPSLDEIHERAWNDCIAMPRQQWGGYCRQLEQQRNAGRQEQTAPQRQPAVVKCPEGSFWNGYGCTTK